MTRTKLRYGYYRRIILQRQEILFLARYLNLTSRFLKIIFINKSAGDMVGI